MPFEPQAYKITELSSETWPDFERLFSRGNGWDFCWCMHFHRARLRSQGESLRTRAERSLRNRREKSELVSKGRSHGILVYADGEPVGWCQYGSREELPRIDHSPHYRGRKPKSKTVWRITCFVVDKRYRRRGIAAVALKAALESIRKQGGGVVEAYPVRDWDQLRRSEVRRRGRAPAFGNVSTHGTMSMFKNEGFKVVGPFGTLNVLMQKEL